MRYWYGYTGDSLIVGHGRTIHQLVPQSNELRRLLDTGNENYAHYAATAERRAQSVSAETFIAAILAPLTMQELGISSPAATAFSSAGQVLRLFDGMNIDQVAVNLFNGRIASTYAEGDTATIAARVTHGFDDGDLLALPRDAVRLQTQEILNTLPGVIVFLLSRSHAERKAFSNYLRSGTSPVITMNMRATIGAARPILRTWKREVRLETHYAGAGA